MGDAIGFAETRVGTDMIALPMFGWTIFLDRKSE
jgi:hypothetical protein